MYRVLLAALIAGLCFASGCRSAAPNRTIPDWLPRIDGTYKGEIFDEGKLCPGLTQFTANEKEGFSGRYLITLGTNHYSKGALYGFTFPGGRRIKCRWLDANGVGNLDITFDKSFTHFTGFWNSDENSIRGKWDGYLIPENDK